MFSGRWGLGTLRSDSRSMAFSPYSIIQLLNDRCSRIQQIQANEDQRILCPFERHEPFPGSRYLPGGGHVSMVEEVLFLFCIPRHGAR